MQNHANTCSTTAVSKINAITQYQLSLHNIAGEERVRRNVGEIATNSRDLEKIEQHALTSF